MDQRKEEIVEIALKRFSHYGFNKTTMNEVADDLNISKANLYYYYPDKGSLIKDVILHVSKTIYEDERLLIDKYDYNFLDTIYSVLTNRTEYMKKYYILHINENLEWIKGVDIDDMMGKFFEKDVSSIGRLFDMAIAAGELIINDPKTASRSYVEVIKGLGILCNVSDVLTGIPTLSNADKILDTQRRATELIFEGKLVSK